MHKSSYCGINCEKCVVYLATTADDDNLRRDVIRDWGALYKRDFTLSDINCKGCKSDMLFTLCSMCDIGKCNGDNNVTNCADCPNFECDRIKRFFNFHKTHDVGNSFE